MSQSEKLQAPAVHVKRQEEPTKKYYFEHKKMSGQRHSCVMGSAPIKGKEQLQDTVKKFSAMDGEIVELTDSEYNHLRTRGINKPIMDIGPGGEKRPTGHSRLDRRFELSPV